MHIAASLSQTKLSQQIELRLTAAYQALGYQLIVHRLPSGRSLLMANQDDFDGEFFGPVQSPANFHSYRQHLIHWPLFSCMLMS